MRPKCRNVHPRHAAPASRTEIRNRYARDVEDPEPAPTYRREVLTTCPAEALGNQTIAGRGESPMGPEIASPTNDETSEAPVRAGRREWIGLVVLALPTLLVSIDVFVMLLALPHLSEAL